LSSAVSLANPFVFHLLYRNIYTINLLNSSLKAQVVKHKESMLSSKGNLTFYYMQ